MSFADRLHREKTRLGLTQAQLAKVLGCGKRTVEHWLAGTREPLAITQEGALSRLKARRPRK